MVESKTRCASCGAEVTSEPNVSYCSACGAVMGAASGQDAAGRGVALRIWLSVLLLGLAAYGGLTLWRLSHASRRTHVNQPEYVEETGFQVADFELTERSGRPFKSQELAGQIWIASFFFSTCGGECVQLNHAIGDLLAGDLAKEPSPQQPVRFVSISVDPENDTPTRLSEYADRYIKPRNIDPQRWLFLTDVRGSEDIIAAVSQGSFQVPFAKATHNAKLMLVDQQGLVRGYYSRSDPDDLKRLKKNLRELHQQPPDKNPPAKDVKNGAAQNGKSSSRKDAA